MFTASSVEEIWFAMSKCKGGETIWIAPGDYGDFEVPLSAPVTLAGNGGATFSRLYGKNLTGITFERLRIKTPPEYGSDDYTRIISEFENCYNLTFRVCTFQGNTGDVVAGGGESYNRYGMGRGLLFPGASSNILIDNCFFSDLHVGVVLPDNSTLTKSTFSNMSMDGARVIAKANVTIEGNSFRDFNRPPDRGIHPDAIQLYTYKQDRPSVNINISNNIIDIGKGTWHQGVFVHNEAVEDHGDGYPMFYRNIVIKDNLIKGSHRNAIHMDGCFGATVTGNTLVHTLGSEKDRDSLGQQPQVIIEGSVYNLVEENNTSIPLEKNQNV